MIKLIYIPALITTLILLAKPGFAQTYSAEIIIKNQPDKIVYFGQIKGDNFIKTDSAFAKNELVKFTFPKDAETGVYQIVMGKTKYAEVMDEEPQHLDFIFNNEDIVIETDFKSPETKSKVIKSTENEVWFLFKTKQRIIKQEINSLTKEVDYYWNIKDKKDAIPKADELNRLQIEYDLFVKQSVKNADSLFAARLIAAEKEPMLDGYLTKEQRTELFKREYLKAIDFSDESLINSQVYTNRIFNYLVSYNKHGMTKTEREKAYKKAVDEIAANTNKNPKVYKFILNYIIHGFKVLKMDTLISYIELEYCEKQ